MNCQSISNHPLWIFILACLGTQLRHLVCIASWCLSKNSQLNIPVTQASSRICLPLAPLSYIWKLLWNSHLKYRSASEQWLLKETFGAGYLFPLERVYWKRDIPISELIAQPCHWSCQKQRGLGDALWAKKGGYHRTSRIVGSTFYLFIYCC